MDQRMLHASQVAIAFAVAVGANLLTSATAAANEVCWDFEADAIGSYLDPYERSVGTAPFYHGIFKFENLVSGAAFDIVSHNGSKALAPDVTLADPNVWLRISAYHDFSRPTSMKFGLGAWNGDVYVAAYDASDGLLWDDTFAADANHSVEITGVSAPIAYVDVFGGDHEVFIDNVCIDNP